MRRRLELLGFEPAQIESYIARHEQAYVDLLRLREENTEPAFLNIGD